MRVRLLRNVNQALGGFLTGCIVEVTEQAGQELLAAGLAVQMPPEVRAIPPEPEIGSEASAKKKPKPAARPQTTPDKES